MHTCHTTCFPIHSMFVSLAPQCDSSIGPGRHNGINRSIFLQLHLLKFHVVLALHTGLVSCSLCQITKHTRLKLFVGFVDLFSILQWQKSTNAADCEYSAWVM